MNRLQILAYNNNQIMPTDWINRSIAAQRGSLKDWISLDIKKIIVFFRFWAYECKNIFNRNQGTSANSATELHLVLCNPLSSKDIW